jgi:hypothetical protein
MSDRPGRRLAVLMGDLVASRAAPSAERLHAAFNAGIAAFNADHGAALVSPLTITLGDEFQGLVRSLGEAFALMHAMRLHFMDEGVACRFVLGAATVETEINPERAWNMMGAGLSEARELLNDKDDPNAYRFSLPAAPLLQASLNTHGYTMTYVEELWTDTQRAYFSKALRRRDTTYVELAEAIGVSVRNLHNVLRAGHRELYERQLETIRPALARLDATPAAP